MVRGAEFAYEEGLRAYNDLLSQSCYGRFKVGDLVTLEGMNQHVTGHIRTLRASIEDPLWRDRVNLQHSSALAILGDISHRFVEDVLKATVAASNRIETIRCEARIAHALRYRPGGSFLNISDLPNEILLRIIEDVNDFGPPDEAFSKLEFAHSFCRRSQDSQSIQNVRLVCQRLCMLSSRFLVPVLSMRTDPRGLARLEAVSRHPLISKGVRFIDLGIISLPVQKHRDGFAKACLDALHDFERIYARRMSQSSVLTANLISCKRRRPEIIKNLHSDLQHLDNTVRNIAAADMLMQSPAGRAGARRVSMNDIFALAYEEYRQRYLQQRAMVEDGSLIQRIAMAVARMPLADYLCVSDRWSYDAECRPAGWFTVSEEPLHIASALAQLVEQSDEAKSEQRQRDSKLYFEVVQQLPPAVMAAGAPLRGFGINIGPHSSFASFITDERLAQQKLACQQLTAFSFRARTNILWLDTFPTADDRSRLLSLVLASVSSPNLRDLRLSPGPPTIGKMAISILSTVSTSNLQRLHVDDLACQLSVLRDFLASVPNKITLHFGLLLFRGVWSPVEAMNMLREKADQSSTLRTIAGMEPQLISLSPEKLTGYIRGQSDDILGALQPL